jgi:hypothetical protein
MGERPAGEDSIGIWDVLPVGADRRTSTVVVIFDV